MAHHKVGYSERVRFLAGKGEVFDRKKFNEMLDEYYEIRGLNKDDGRISKKKLLQLGLKDVAQALSKEKLTF